MKNKIYLSLLLFFALQQLQAQNIFPATGRTGIFTTTPTASLQVRGGARFGTSVTNFVNIDSATGNLSFNGNSQYRVGGNQYAFAFAGNPNYGLFFNQTSVRYEFRNSAAAPSFFVGADDGNGVFTGGVRVGNSNSNIEGNIRWTGTDFEGFNGSAWQSLSTGTGANKSLSNLIAPTALNVDLLPNITNSINLGSSLLRYKDINMQSLKFADGTTQNTAFTPYIAGAGISISGTSPNLIISSTVTPTQWTNFNGDISYLGNVGIGTSGTVGARLSVVGGDALINELTIGNGGNGIITNTALGIYALSSNTFGTSNTAIGWHPLESNTTGSQNTAVGRSALLSNTTGSQNTALGYQSLNFNSTGFQNTANGSFALYSNTTGNYNMANGVNALYSNTTGYYNTASGRNSLYSNTTGTANTAVGADALENNTTGSNNTASGRSALSSNTTGYSNVAIGIAALGKNTGLNNQVAVGDSALYNLNGGGGFNTATGSKALYANTTGQENAAFGFGSLQRTTTGNYNAAIGTSSLTNNISGASNTAVGTNAIGKATTASDNTAIGTNALNNTTTGGNNTAVGRSALTTNTTGTFNTAIGYNANVSAAALTNATAIGNGAIATASNQIMLGNSTVSVVRTFATVIVPSDGRFKKNIKENVPGLSFINALRPVTYNYDVHGLNDMIKAGIKNEKLANETPDASAEAAINAKEKKKMYTGFIAQEVEKLTDKIGYDFNGLYKPQNDKDPYGLGYAEFVVPLVKAVQELSEQNDELKKQNDYLQQQIEEIKSMIAANSNTTPGNTTTQQAVLSSTNASLSQNIPNPFNNYTVIKYQLPQQTKQAIIQVSTADGKTIKSFVLTTKGNGQLNLQTAELAAGTYRYSLVVDGKLIDTKTMVLIK